MQSETEDRQAIVYLLAELGLITGILCAKTRGLLLQAARPTARVGEFYGSGNLLLRMSLP